MRVKNFLPVFLSPAIFLAFSVESAPIDLRLDYGFSGTTNPRPSAGWNELEPSPSGTRLSARGNSGVLTDFQTQAPNSDGVTVNGDFDTFGFNDRRGGQWNSMQDRGVFEYAAAFDNVFVRGSALLTFSGLLDGSYEISVLAAVGQTAAVIQDISVNGVFADRDANNSGERGDNWDPSNSNFISANYLIWDAVTPVMGEITVNFDSSIEATGFNNQFATLSAVVLRSVEPAAAVPVHGSLWLMIIGLLGARLNKSKVRL